MYKTTDNFKTERDLTIALVRDLYDNGEGLPVKVIAEQYHCSPSTVRDRIRRGGGEVVPLRVGPSRVHPLKIRQAVFMYEELGMSAKEIAHLMGYKHYCSITRILRRANVELRTRNENSEIGYQVRRGTRKIPVERVKRVA